MSNLEVNQVVHWNNGRPYYKARVGVILLVVPAKQLPNRLWLRSEGIPKEIASTLDLSTTKTRDHESYIIASRTTPKRKWRLMWPRVAGNLNLVNDTEAHQKLVGGRIGTDLPTVDDNGIVHIKVK